MDSYDSEKAARVWQRVYPGGIASLSGESLNAFILQLQQLFATYRHFSGRSTVLKVLSDKKRDQVACLRGLHILAFGPCPESRLPQQKTEPFLAALRRCYAVEMQLLTQFELHSAAPSHGPVFAALTAEQKAHCNILLKLAGK